PMALVNADFPVLAFLPTDKTRAGVEDTIETLRAHGATVMVVGGDGQNSLEMVQGNPLLEPIAQAQALYRLVNALAALRGHNPDAPPHLAKVTETL
ncbi:MAG: iron dicitrate transport regulator FecR, partial [Pseudomonadota bacterium]|nr:iron dicitrate transport regulator FecR [Pseudomonadota bacterium]